MTLQHPPAPFLRLYFSRKSICVQCNAAQQTNERRRRHGMPQASAGMARTHSTLSATPLNAHAQQKGRAELERPSSRRENSCATHIAVTQEAHTADHEETEHPAKATRLMEAKQRHSDTYLPLVDRAAAPLADESDRVERLHPCAKEHTTSTES
jgi:hypothetical protein